MRFPLRILPAALFAAAAPAPAAETSATEPSVASVAKQCLQVLEGIRALAYDHTLVMNYPSQGFHLEWAARCHWDYMEVGNDMGSRYWVSNATDSHVFNGHVAFDINVNEGTMKVTEAPDVRYFESKRFNLFSIQTVRRLLRELVARPDLPFNSGVTTGADSVTLFLETENHYLSPLGIVHPSRKPVEFRYEMQFEKGSLLPSGFRQYLDSGRNDYVATSFSNVEIDPPDPIDSIWDAATYIETFDIAVDRDSEPMQPGAKAPPFDLPVFGTSQTRRIPGSTARPLLLGFFDCFCGHSIRAVESLNRFSERFGRESLEIAYVNAGNQERAIEAFIRNTEPRFAILHEGESAAEAYGISYYPTVFVISEEMIVYAGPFDEATLVKVIEGRLP